MNVRGRMGTPLYVPDDSTRTGDLPMVARADAMLYLVALAGPGLGEARRLGHDAMTIGRGTEADFVIPDDDVSRLHVRVERRGRELEVTDLESKNGVFRDGQERVAKSATLHVGERLYLGAHTVLLFCERDEVDVQYEARLKQKARLDGLTKIASRAYLDERLGLEVEHARRHRAGLSLLLVDVDSFVDLNRTLGRAGGDQVLYGVAQRLRKLVRVDDLVVRFSGQQFAMLLRSTSLEGARVLAQRVLAVVGAEPIAIGDRPVPVTASVGVATLDLDRSVTAKAFTSAATRALSQAKSMGAGSLAVAPLR